MWIKEKSPLRNRHAAKEAILEHYHHKLILLQLGLTWLTEIFNR